MDLKPTRKKAPWKQDGTEEAPKPLESIGAGGANRLDLDADSHTFKARLTFRTGPLFH